MAWLLGVCKVSSRRHNAQETYSEVHHSIVESSGKGDLVELNVFGLSLSSALLERVMTYPLEL